VKHVWEYVRAPRAAAWTETAAGKALIQALQRVTLNGLSELSGSSRLRADLKLTSADMSQLFSILVADGWLERQEIADAQSDPSIDVLVSRMSLARRVREPANGRDLSSTPCPEGAEAGSRQE